QPSAPQCRPPRSAAPTRSSYDEAPRVHHAGRRRGCVPPAAGPQQPPMPVIGLIDAASAADRSDVMVAFREALAEAGYVEGQNVAIEYRWAEGRYDRLPEL